jgi:hypothetical protein
MNRVFHFIMCEVRRELLLQSFKKEGKTGETLVFDIDLKKDTKYAVRGRVPKGFGQLRLSLKDTAGLTIPTYADPDMKYFFFITKKDGCVKSWQQFSRLRK